MLVSVYVFYTVCLYGFFMGFPVFNVLLGIVAGYYVGKRIVYTNVAVPQQARMIQRVSYFTTCIMVCLCCLSGSLVLCESTIGEELQHLLNLGFDVTQGMVVAIILLGGATLVLTQYYVTKATVMKTIEIVTKTSSTAV